ncbi:MAG: hydrolase [Clostridia bacterium]|nr:hydrolase [Clostridia bacterium]
MDYKNEFITLFKENIKRDGSDKLLDWIEKSDFFTAPASTKFHSNFEGGLCEHSVKAYKRFVKNLENEFGKNWENKISKESAATIGLLHDICKIGYYKQEMRNVKENGNWVQKPYFAVDDKLPYGHGEKSVYILSGFIKLTREEAMAINWHMGGFDTRVMGGSYSMSAAFYDFPIALLFHISDLEATYLDEKVEE